jgi:hypothetical protein
LLVSNHMAAHQSLEAGEVAFGGGQLSSLAIIFRMESALLGPTLVASTASD